MRPLDDNCYPLRLGTISRQANTRAVSRTWNRTETPEQELGPKHATRKAARHLDTTDREPAISCKSHLFVFSLTIHSLRSGLQT